MANLRTFYACQAVRAAGPSGSDGGTVNGNTTASTTVLEGIQSLGMTTNYNLEPVYQLGRIAPADQYENTPEIEVTFTQALTEGSDAWNYFMGAGTLSQCSDARGEVTIAYHAQTGDATSTNNLAECTIRPAYLQSATFNFPSDGLFTADYTVVGNSKVWSYADSNDNRPSENLTGVQRRNFVDQGSSQFSNFDGVSGAIPAGSKIQNVTISVDLGREDLYELGKQLPFTRYINFPVEVTTEIEVIAASGDYASVTEASADCANAKNLQNQNIQVVLCDGRYFDCGGKNKLQSVSQAGGDAGGDNVTYTYSYINYSEFGYGTSNLLSNQPMEQVDFDNYDAFGNELKK